ncbi:O-antigen ligase family protein [Patescibacteria group bacterium]|nr:O-antigen ligase family protein [Patescibacteria group bacterium]
MKYLNKIIEYGLYFFVFILPIQTRWIIKAGETEYSTYSLYGTDILLLVLLILFVLKFSIFSRILRDQFSPAYCGINFLPHTAGSIFNFQTKYKIQIWWLILGLVLTSAVSIFFALDKLLALYKFGWLIMGVGLFWLIISANYNKFKLIYFLLAGIFLQALLGIWQFLIQSSFANKWLGIASHNSSDLGVSVVESIGERWLRAYGGLDHPNMFGVVVVVGILLLIGQISQKFIKSKVESQKFIKLEVNKIKNKKSEAILYTLYFILYTYFFALFFSFSRAAWLGLIIGLIVIIVFAIISKNLLLQKQLVKIILVMGVLFFVLFSQCQNLVIARVSSEGRLETKSITERASLYQDYWQFIKKNWLVGGIRNQELGIIAGIRNQELGIRENLQPVHNTFLLVWSEIGVFGLIFFIGLLAYLIILNFKFQILNFQQGNKNQTTYILNLSILSCLIIFMFFDHWWWSLHFGVLFFWLIIGLQSRNNELGIRN